MNAYHVADVAGTVRGPFAESQIRAMWERGELTMDDQVCLQGAEEWVPVLDELQALDKMKAKPSRKVSAEVLRKRTVSVSAAVLLSLVVPGAGHLYAGNVAKGLLFVLLNIAAWWMALQGFWPVLILVNLVAMWDASRVAKEANEIW